MEKSDMKHMASYTLKPDRVAENERFVEAVSRPCAKRGLPG